MKRSLLLRIVVPALAGLAFCSPLHAQRAIQKNPTTGALLEGFKSGANTIEISATGTLLFNSGFTLTGGSYLKTALSLNNVENTALSTWAGTTNLTTLGTITAGIWTGTAIAVANGGTGSTTAADARAALGLAIGTNVQAYDAKLAAFASLANASGVLTNDGIGAFSYTSTSQGGNGAADDNKILRFDSNGGLTLTASLSVVTGAAAFTNYHSDKIVYTDGIYVQTLYPATLTGNRNHYLPDRSGTLLHADGSGASLTGLSPYQLAQVSATDGQALAWSTANSRWQPLTISSGLTIGTTAISGGSSQGVLYHKSDNTVGEATGITLSSGALAGILVNASSGTLIDAQISGSSVFNVTTSSVNIGRYASYGTGSGNIGWSGLYGSSYWQQGGGGNWNLNAGLGTNGGYIVITASGGAASYIKTHGSDHIGISSSTTAQRFSVFNTYSSTTSLESFSIDFQTTSNVARVGTVKGSGGGSAREWLLQYDSTEKARVTSAGFQIGTRGSGISAVATVVKSAHDCASIAAGATEITTATITGAAAGSTFIPSPIYHEGLVISAARTASNTITITFYNPTAGAIDASAVDVRVTEIAF